MAIEIIPRPKVKIPLWVTMLLIADIIVFLAVAGTYFYFYHSSRQKEAEIKEIDKELARTPEERSMEDSLANTSQRISEFGKILRQHKKTSQLFSFLEKVAHPQVLFTDFNFKSKGSLVSLGGKAGSFSVVGEQMEILRNNDLVKEIKLEQLSMGKENEGGAIFLLQLVFEPGVLE
jgi:hypothetical protein